MVSLLPPLCELPPPSHQPSKMLGHIITHLSKHLPYHLAPHLLKLISFTVTLHTIDSLVPHDFLAMYSVIHTLSFVLQLPFPFVGPLTRSISIEPSPCCCCFQSCSQPGNFVASSFTSFRHLHIPHLRNSSLVHCPTFQPEP